MRIPPLAFLSFSAQLLISDPAFPKPSIPNRRHERNQITYSACKSPLCTPNLCNPRSPSTHMPCPFLHSLSTWEHRRHTYCNSLGDIHHIDRYSRCSWQTCSLDCGSKDIDRPSFVSGWSKYFEQSVGWARDRYLLFFGWDCFVFGQCAVTE